VYLRPMLFYKTSKGHAKIFDILGLFSLFTTTARVGAKPIGFHRNQLINW
jgi:hypothetical protein